jgi:hypothetical protein
MARYEDTGHGKALDIGGRWLGWRMIVGEVNGVDRINDGLRRGKDGVWVMV